MAVMLLGSAAGLAAAHLYPATVLAWDTYVSVTEKRIARTELKSTRGFLSLDFAPAGSRGSQRAVLAATVIVEPMERPVSAEKRSRCRPRWCITGVAPS